MTDGYDGEPFGREDVLARKADRLDRLEVERRDFRVVALFGILMMGMAGGIGWFTRETLRRGYLDLDEGPSLVYAAEEPVFFYGCVAFFVAMGLLCAVLGVGMLRHARHERRRTDRLADRLRRVGR